jgi:hypothetical protein
MCRDDPPGVGSFLEADSAWCYAPHVPKIDRITVTYTDTPRHGDFTVTVPPGEYSRAELLDIYFSAFNAAAAQAPVKSFDIPVSIEVGTEADPILARGGVISLTRS